MNLALGTSSGADGADQLLNLEGAVGSAFDDTLVGGANNHFIEGGTGNDRLDGGLGVDYLGHQLALGSTLFLWQLAETDANHAQVDLVGLAQTGLTYAS